MVKRAKIKSTATPEPAGELCHLTIAEAGRLIGSKELSPVELVEAFLSRIDAIDPQIEAFITLTAEHAMRQAQAAEAEIGAGGYRGPMHGIPFALKDIVNTAGIPTTANSRILANHVPATDATLVTRLYEAGGILVGKLATYEFAHGEPAYDLPWPPPRNPWNREHFTSGSSSGSAAAVAAGFVPGAIGTDTGGSIRNPASFCGIVGLKPTFGLVGRGGVIPNSFSFDHCGPMTWDVEDCAIMLQTIAGHDGSDPASSARPVPDYRAMLGEEIRKMRIGVVRHFWEDDLPANDEVKQAMEAALEVFRELGATIEEVRLRPLHEYYDVKMIIGRLKFLRSTSAT